MGTGVEWTVPGETGMMTEATGEIATGLTAVDGMIKTTGCRIQDGETVWIRIPVIGKTDPTVENQVKEVEAVGISGDQAVRVLSRNNRVAVLEEDPSREAAEDLCKEAAAEVWMWATSGLNIPTPSKQCPKDLSV
jgi:hypothetical protein